MTCWIFILVQKRQYCQKRKFLLHGTLKIVPSLPHKTRKQKKENQSFLSLQFYVFPEY
jgi:hypothetical protein